MWLFTSFGFFSIVAHRKDPGSLLVRARARADLAALAEFSGCRLHIVHTPRADYPYRAQLARGAFAKILPRLALAIDYDNFKTAVARRAGPARARPLHAVWEAMRSIEDEAARRLL